MSDVPVWIQVLQALATPSIALGVGIIGFMQWRTAHHRAMMDLFDRRMEVYNEAAEMFREVVRHGVHVDVYKAGRFHDVRNRARFLFGKEVTDWLKGWHELLIDMTTSAAMFKDQDISPERERHVATAYEALKKVLKFPEQFPHLCEPYMKMDQKRVRTPSEWFNDKDRQRQSYGDSAS
ncbi:hypothetical protein [Mesorhizobium sp.]|uniref:hypothetical protein n=1 Tax=Mesorhizobium sp. TaxID=1871066 RepID=UPI000FE69854|nr:hypothetical protein [Mesorhizobium sp.]RWD35575.1 MAG: hypothetical protein EOS33_07230 [Mesorhizobium sp.]